MKRLVFFVSTVVGILMGSTCLAQTPECNDLTGAFAQTAQKVFTSPRTYSCCTENIESCVANHPECKVGPILANEVCRLASTGTSALNIENIIQQRAKTLYSDAPAATIDFKPHHIWGNQEAKVVLSIYMCARCQFCSRYVPLMIEYLSASALKDKVSVNLRPFPIKSHPGSTPAAIAVEAAATMGKGWEYLIYSYKHFNEFTEDKLPIWAKDLGLNVDEFNERFSDVNTKKAVSKSKKEGLTNNVTNTPTFFVNGIMYPGKFDVNTMMSILEEAVLLSESSKN